MVVAHTFLKAKKKRNQGGKPKHFNGSPDFIMMTLMIEIIFPMTMMPMKTKMFLFYPMALCLPQVTLLMWPPPPRP